MAGDWIAMRTDLNDDPAVIQIAEILDLDEYAVVGRLHKLWSWADRHTVDGNAQSVTAAWIDRFLGTAGFAAAMLKAGWLRSRSAHLEFPEFSRWNSQSAKQRLLTAKRVAAHKAKGGANDEGNAQGNGKGNAASVSDALPTGQDRTGQKRKRRRTPLPPKGARIRKSRPRDLLNQSRFPRCSILPSSAKRGLIGSRIANHAGRP